LVIEVKNDHVADGLGRGPVTGANASVALCAVVRQVGVPTDRQRTLPYTTEDQLIDADERGQQPDLHRYYYATNRQPRIVKEMSLCCAGRLGGE
jgi:hypothetical protein